jgi:voltage-gated potassium channel
VANVVRRKLAAQTALTAGRRVAIAAAVLLAVVLLGGLGVWIVGSEYTLAEALYFSLITVSTVGYSELPDFAAHPGARGVTVVLILVGLAALALFQSTLTAFIVEGAVGQIWRKNRMRQKIEALGGHCIVCGCGRTGRHVAAELRVARQPFVVVDRDEAVVLRLNEELGGDLLWVVGDADDDHTLIQAGIERASGLVAALPDDPSNLFLTVSARFRNPRARIVTKVVEASNEGKFHKAGANAMVSPHRIGGLRLATELIRPKVTEFLDATQKIGDRTLVLEEVELPEACRFAGSTLREVPIRQETNLLVVAVHEPGRGFVYNPASSHVLRAGTTLIVLGEPEGVRKLRGLVANVGTA